MLRCNIRGCDKHDGDLGGAVQGEPPPMVHGAGQWTSNGLFRTLLARLRAWLFPFSIALTEIVLFCFCFLESKFRDVPFYERAYYHLWFLRLLSNLQTQTWAFLLDLRESYI